jgi:hypothetical protein
MGGAAGTVGIALMADTGEAMPLVLVQSRTQLDRTARSRLVGELSSPFPETIVSRRIRS